MNHTLGPTALIHFTCHKCHRQEFTLAYITNKKAQQTHNNEYRYIFPVTMTSLKGIQVLKNHATKSFKYAGGLCCLVDLLTGGDDTCGRSTGTKLFIEFFLTQNPETRLDK